MKNLKTSFLLIAAVFIAALINNTLLVPVLFLLIALAYFLKDKKNLIIFYIAFLPLNGLLEREHLLLGFLDSSTLVNLLMFAFSIATFQKYTKGIKLFTFQRIGIQLILFLIIYISYVSFKDAFFGINDISYSYAIIRSINIIIKLYPLILLINVFPKLNITKYVMNGFIIGGILLGILSLFSAFFLQHNFHTGVVSGERIQGFIGNGNTNTLGAFFGTVIGYYFAKYEKEHKMDISELFLIGLSFIIIPLTGSRASLISLLIVLLIFFIKNGIKKKGIILMIFILPAALLVMPLFENTLSRMEILEEQQITTQSGTSNRVGKWLFYIDDMNSNPLTYLIGSNHELLMIKGTKYVSAHNLYIQIVYNAGLIFLIFFLSRFYQCFYNRQKGEIDITYIIAPALLYSITGSGLGVFWYILIFIGFNDLGKINIRKLKLI